MSHGLTVAHAGELCFFEVRDDVRIVDRYHRHQLRAGGNELSDAHRARANGAAHRRGDGRVCEIDFSLLSGRFGAVAQRDRLVALRRQHVELLLRGRQCGACVLQLRRRLLQLCARTLCELHRTEAALQQILVAHVVLPRELQRRGGRIDVGLFLRDHRTLQCELRVEIANATHRPR